jgi:hypothetical protein
VHGGHHNGRRQGGVSSAASGAGLGSVASSFFNNQKR